MQHGKVAPKNDGLYKCFGNYSHVFDLIKGYKR